MTTIYLDVDGVLNPWRARNPQKHWSDYKKFGINDLYEGRLGLIKVWKSNEMAAWLSDIANHATFVWATSWGQNANDYLSPRFGLPQLRVLDWTQATHGWPVGHCPKFWALREDVTGPFVWCDDEITRQDKDWAMDLPFPSLLIAPSPAVGLTKQDLADIEGFVVQHRGSVANAGFAPGF